MVGMGIALLGTFAGCAAPPETNADSNTGGHFASVGGAVAYLGPGIASAGASAGSTVGAPRCNLEEPCGARLASSELKTANLLVLLDKSESMSSPFGTSVTTRWDATKSALSEALNGMRILNVGLDLFPAAEVPFSCGTGMPGGSDPCCATQDPTAALEVPIGSGRERVAEILFKLDSTSPAGGTPMAAALRRAYYQFTTGPGAALAGDKYVLLVTDGGPNCNPNVATECGPSQCTRNLDGIAADCTSTGPSCCNSPTLYTSCLDDEAVRAEIERLLGVGVSTFVVGIPGSEPYLAQLNAFAQAGGHAQPASISGATYYEAAEPSQLTEMLRDIMASLVPTCELPTAVPIGDPSNVFVFKDCVRIPDTDWCAWGGTKLITLQGATCEQSKLTGERSFDYMYGCSDKM
jgi:hypothetical protein